MKRVFKLALAAIMIITAVTFSPSLYAATTTPAKYKTPMTITVYNCGATQVGLQTGWWAKMLKDKFNLTENIISPKVSGQSLFTQRVATKNLGDLFIDHIPNVQTAYKAGLLMDMTKYVANEKYLAGFKVATKNLAKTLGTGNKVYAYAATVSTNSPLTPADGGGYGPWYAPYVNWADYKAIGYPQVDNMDDLAMVLGQMVQKFPTSISGKKVYATLFNHDWDQYFACVPGNIASWYGYTPTPNNNFIFYNNLATKSQAITDNNSLYYKALKWYYDLNQKGLLDPDSPTAGWGDTVTAVGDNLIMMQTQPWNNTQGPDNCNKMIGYEPLIVTDQTYFTYGYAPYGDGTYAFAVGSKCKDPQRMADLLNFMASPEYYYDNMTGPKGWGWAIGKDGKPYQTAAGANISNNPKMPAAYGGGTYVSGQNLIAGTGINLADQANIDPTTGLQYNIWMWPFATKAYDTCALKKDWNAHYHTGMAGNHEGTYLNKIGKISVQPGNSYSMGTESTWLKTERNQCGQAIITASYQMMFASSLSQFNSIWANMKDQLDGLGYSDCLRADRTYVAGYKAAIAQTLKDAGM